MMYRIWKRRSVTFLLLVAVTCALGGLGVAGLSVHRSPGTSAAKPVAVNPVPVKSANKSKAVTIETKTVAVHPRDNGANGPGQIVFSADRLRTQQDRDANIEVYIANADGSQQTRLTNVDAKHLNPALSPDGRFVLFLSDRESPGTFNIYLMHAELESVNNPVTKITNDTVFGGSVGPTTRIGWSPNGHQFVYDDIIGGLWVQNLGPQTDTNRPIQIGNGRQPAFNAQGDMIAYTDAVDQQRVHPDIFTVKLALDSSDTVIPFTSVPTRTQITNDNAVDEFPSWSPDGTRIVYNQRPESADQANQTDLYVVDVTTKAETNLTANHNVIDYQPSWSQDGELIAFMSDGAGKSVTGLQTVGVDNVFTIKPQPETDANGNNFPVWVSYDPNGNTAFDPSFQQASRPLAAAVSGTLTKVAVASSAANAPEVASVPQGGTFAYRFTYSVHNAGTTDVSGVTLQETLPTGATYVSGGDSVFDNNTLVLFGLGTVAAGDTIEGTKTVTVKATGNTGSTITNKTTSYLIQANDTTIYGDKDVTVTVGGTEITGTLTKDAVTSATTSATQIAEIAQGQEFAYRFTYSLQNNGNDALHGATLQETLPDGVAYVSGGDTVSSDQKTITFNIADVKAGGSVNTSVFVTVKATGAVGSTINNRSAAYILNTGGTTIPGDKDVLTKIAAPVTAALSILKSADRSTANGQTVAPGGTITYTLTYRNTSSTATEKNVTITDQLPGEMTYVVNSGTGNAQLLAGNLLKFTIGDLAPQATGTVSFAVTVNAKTGTSVVNNTYSIASDNGSVAGTQIVTTRVEEQHATLTIGKTLLKVNGRFPSSSDPGLAPGDTLLYLVRYANTGSDAANSVRIVDSLPFTSTTFVNAYFSDADGDAIDTPDGGQVVHNQTSATYSLNTLAAGASGQVAVQVKVNEGVSNGVQITNTANISASNASAQSAVVHNNVRLTPRLFITKRVFKVNDHVLGAHEDLTLVPGDNVFYLITYRNAGTAAAAHVEIADAVPAHTAATQGAYFADAYGRNTGTPGGTVDLDTRRLARYHLQSLAANTVGYVVLGVKIDSNAAASTSTISNATYSIAADGIEASNGAAVTNDLRTPFLVRKVAKTDTDATGASVKPGGRITYTLTLTNPGTTAATNLVLFDQIPSGTSAADRVSSGSILSGGGTLTGTPPQASYKIASLAAGQSITKTFSVAVNSTARDSIVNSEYGVISSDLNRTFEGAPVTTRVIAPPGISITKRANVSSVIAGGLITYTLTATNTGSETLHGAAITDAVPENTVLEQAFLGTPDSPAHGTVGISTDPATGAQTAKYALGDLGAGPNAARTVTLQVRVLFDVPTNTTITNSNYHATSGALDSSGPAVAVRVSGPAVKPAVLSLTKSATVDGNSAASTVLPGHFITYTLIARNTGGATARNVTVTDQIPFIGTETAAITSNPDNGKIGSGFIMWSLGDVGAGITKQLHFTIEVPDDADADTVISNDTFFIQSASFKNRIDGNLNSRGVSTPVNVRVAANPPQLFVQKTADKSTTTGLPVKPGEEITYRMIYGNRGGGATTDATYVEDVLPERTSFVSAHFVDSNGGIISAYENEIRRPAVGAFGEGAEVDYHVGALPAGLTSQVQIQLTVQVAPALVETSSVNTITNIARIQDVTIKNSLQLSNKVETTVSYAKPLPAHLQILPNGPAIGFPGDRVIYQVVYMNDGGTAATNVRLRIPIPSRATSFLADVNKYPPYATAPGSSAYTIPGIIDRSIADTPVVLFRFDRVPAKSTGTAYVVVQFSTRKDFTRFPLTGCYITADGIAKTFGLDVITRIAQPNSNGLRASAGGGSHREHDVLSSFFSSVGDFVSHILGGIGGAIDAFSKGLSQIRSRPHRDGTAATPAETQKALETETSKLVPQSLFVTMANSICMQLGNGVTVCLMGDNQVLVSGPAASIVAQGGGNIVAAGGGNIVAQGGGNIVTSASGNIVAQGGGNLISISGISGFGTLKASEIIDRASQIVAQGGGNLIPPSYIVAQGGGNIVAQGGGNFTLNNLVPAPLILDAAGNIVAQGGGNIVAQGGGNVLPSLGAGTGFVTGGENYTGVAGGGILAHGSLIGQDGNGLIGQDGNG